MRLWRYISFPSFDALFVAVNFFIFATRRAQASRTKMRALRSQMRVARAEGPHNGHLLCRQHDKN